MLIDTKEKGQETNISDIDAMPRHRPPKLQDYPCRSLMSKEEIYEIFSLKERRGCSPLGGQFHATEALNYNCWLMTQSGPRKIFYADLILKKRGEGHRLHKLLEMYADSGAIISITLPYLYVNNQDTQTFPCRVRYVTQHNENLAYEHYQLEAII